jgi:inner membrane organizing system protein 1
VAGGFTVGAILSLVLFKRRSWPIVFGLGSGFGMAFSNCQNELNAMVVKKSK